MRYPIFIHKARNEPYGVDIPDLKGCFSVGDNIDQAIQNAHEAIECHIEGLLIDEIPVPIAKKIEDHVNSTTYQDGIWALVEIDMSKLSGRAKRINITLPERILRQIDKFTHVHGGNRSGFLAEASLEYMTAHNKT